MLKHLQILICHSNNITTIGDKAFRGVHGSLTTLDLSMNRLSCLPAKIIRLRKLKYLRLKSNLIEKLPHDLGKCRRIIEMDIGMNCLHTLPNNMEGFELLQSLDLQRNQLEDG